MRWIVVLLSLWVAMPAYAESRSELADRIEDATRFIEEMMDAPDTAIPRSLLEKAHGIMIIRQYKGGFIFGVKGGKGIALAKTASGDWSPPAFVQGLEGSYGLQIGGQSVDSIFLIMNESGMEMLYKSKFKVGVDASVAAGPVGRDGEVKVSPQVAIFAYSRAQGLYAGASFEGGYLGRDADGNRTFYQDSNIHIEDIFRGRVGIPPEARELIRLLEDWSR